MPTLSERIEEALGRMNAKMPELTPEVVEEIKQLQEKMKRLSSEPPKPLPDGAYHGSLNSEYLRTLRDGLAVYRNVVLPAMMQQEVNKLRGVAALAEALDKNGEFSEATQDLAGASTGRPGGQGGPGEGGGPERAPAGR